jgi:hypothetical protein
MIAVSRGTSFGVRVCFFGVRPNSAPVCRVVHMQVSEITGLWTTRMMPTSSMTSLTSTSLSTTSGIHVSHVGIVAKPRGCGMRIDRWPSMRSIFCTLDDISSFGEMW